MPSNSGYKNCCLYGWLPTVLICAPTRDHSAIAVRRLGKLPRSLESNIFAKFHPPIETEGQSSRMSPVPPIFDGFNKAGGPLSDVMDHDKWFVLLAVALHGAAREPDETRPPEARCLELWKMNPTIRHSNNPPSQLQEAVKVARSSKDISFTWADCEIPLSTFTCVADRISKEMLESER